MGRFSRTPWMSRIASMSNRRFSPRPREGSLWLATTAEAVDGPAAHSLPELAARPVVPIPVDKAAAAVAEAPDDPTLAHPQDAHRDG